MATFDMKKALANAQSKWKKAKKRVETEEPRFTEYEDGRYIAKLTDAKLGQSANGRTQIDFSWKFKDGEYTGKTKHAYQGVETEDNLFFLGRDLERLGYELPDDLTDLPELLKALVKEGPVARITLKTNGDFQNVYIGKVYSADEQEEEEEEEEDSEEEESDDAADEEESEEEEESDDDSDSDSESDDDAEESDDSEESDDDDDAEESESDDSDDDDESSDEEGDEDEDVEIVEGMKVVAETAKGKKAGVIIEILEKEEKVKVKLKDGKVVRVGVDAIEVEAPEEKVPEKPAKKAAPKAAPPKKTGKPIKKKKR